jgi:hypothetical protein
MQSLQSRWPPCCSLGPWLCCFVVGRSSDTAAQGFPLSSQYGETAPSALPDLSRPTSDTSCSRRDNPAVPTAGHHVPATPTGLDACRINLWGALRVCPLFKRRLVAGGEGVEPSQSEPESTQT